MARRSPTALDALNKLREERFALDLREAELRTAAATELGRIALDAGADRLEPAQLKRLLELAVPLGAKAAIDRLASVTRPQD